MALDAMFISHLARELGNEICDARIDKIHQPERDEIILNLRSRGGNIRLLLSAGANYPRVHLTTKTKENPQTPPMFCMLMRKYLTGGRILSISQPRLERILDIVVEANDEMGVPKKKIITIEMMGRHSNIILRDENDRVLDCLKRIDMEMSEKRQVLPGLFYDLPPAQNKIDPRSLSRAQILDILIAEGSEVLAEKWLLSTFLGVSPLICREMVYRATGSVDTRISEMDLSEKERLANAVLTVCTGESVPLILLDGNRPADFAFCSIRQYEGHLVEKIMDSFSSLLDGFYCERDRQECMRQRSQGLMKTIRNAHARAARKLATQIDEVRVAKKRERLRELGDIITANIYQLDRGMTQFTALDFFDPESPEIVIKLDPFLTPQQNAAKLYKNYNRMKNAELMLGEQIKKGEEELEYLESVIESLEKAESESDLSEIREELSETGYLSIPKGKKKTRMLAPREFRSSDGFRIYAGRNNRQNDLLTLKSALKGDIWMHTQKIPGSHVIVECAGCQPPDQTLTEAAMIAAYYSRASDSEKIPVDYTQVRNVKKPPGAKPGMVIYSKFNTAFVTPDESLIGKLKEAAAKGGN